MKKRRIISLAVTTMLLISMVSMFGFGAGAADPADSDVLSPGVFDDLSTDKYFDFYIRGTWYDKGGGNDYDWNTEDGYTATFLKITKTQWGVGDTWQKYLGTFMGVTIPYAYISNMGFNGSSMIYKVEENSYIATALARKKECPEEGMEHFDFKVSSDRENWVPVTPTITLSSDHIPDVSYCVAYKAVVQIPEGMSYYMITIPGFNRSATNGNEYTWSLRDKEHWPTGAANNYHIGCSIASAYDLTQYDTIDEVPEFKTYKLKPGVFDDLSTNDYFKFFIRGTWYDKGGGNNYNWNNEDDYNKTFSRVTKTHWDRTKFLGTFMGETIPFAYLSLIPFNGSSLLYEVEEKCYIATAIIRKSDSLEEGMEHFDFKVSADRETWTTVTPTITQSNVEDSDSFCCAYKAVIQIPEGMSYYMITIPGFNRSAANGNEYTYSLRDQEHWPGRNPEGYFIGCSLGSAYDLTQYDLMYKVPDSPNYYKAELRDAIAQATAIRLELYIDDDAKTQFAQALNDAKDVMGDDDATIEEVDDATDSLNSAMEALSEKALPSGATIGRDDERLILKPGVADWLDGSVFLNSQSNPLTATNGTSEWYCCYTDYADAGLLSTQDSLYLNPEVYIHATSYDFYLYNTFKTLSFMGKTIESLFLNRAAWAGSNLVYKVYADSYLATAIVVYTESRSAKDFPNVQDDYVFQVSADKTEWQTVEADMEKIETVGKFDVYKAVVKIPADCYYCRIVMPKPELISPDTLYTSNAPHYDNTFIGPSIASMYDLGDYDDYDDIPDATEWYADASLTSNDTSKVLISGEYFKCLAAGMSISDALAALDLETAGVDFYSKDGAKITDTSTKLTTGMKVDILDSKGISLSKALGVPMLTVASGTDLLSIGELADIELENGVPKTAAGLKLPATVKIESGNGEFDAEIEWDIAGFSYNPEVTQIQQFTVNGTVVLPEGVTNSNDVDLNISVKITVLATDDFDVVSTDETKVRIDKELGIIFVKKGLTLKELNDILDPVGDSFVQFADAEGNDIEDLDVEAKKGMTVDVYSSMVLIKSYEIDYLSGGNPDTGNAFNLLPAMFLVIISVALAFFIKKRRLIL